MGSGRVLVVASWGFPPAWFKFRYYLRFDHVGLRESLGGLDGFSCSSCSSTLVIVSALKAAGFRCDSLIFGTDSVINPSSVDGGASLRKCAIEQYRSWLDSLWRECECCSGAPEGFVIHVLPGVGKYFGWRFGGTLDYLFNSVYTVVLSKLLSGGYNWVVLDLTHGINFQAITTLYATVAASVTTDLEDRLVLVNSEPAVGGRERCIEFSKGRGGTEVTESLSVIDVSRLQEVIKLVRYIKNLLTLNPSAQLARATKEVRRIKELSEAVIPIQEYVLALTNALAGPTFPNAYCLDSEEFRVSDKVLSNPCID